MASRVTRRLLYDLAVLAAVIGIAAVVGGRVLIVLAVLLILVGIGTHDR